MKLHVCRVPGGNFGDDLNDTLWPGLFPDLLDSDNPSIVYGIGSILGGENTSTAANIVLGSGLGYKKAKPLGSEWDIRWVRGRLSAHALGISETLALGDSALLWPKLKPTGLSGTEIGLIPHHATWESFDWKTIAGQAGLLAINPKDSPETVQTQIGQCRSVITESLHGAIFADGLRVPWQAVALSYRFNRFKWKDWLSITGVEFTHTAAPFALTDAIRPVRGLKNRFAKALRPDDDMRLNSLRPLHPARMPECASVIDYLGEIARTDAHLRLSKPDVLASIQARMADAGRRFALDYGLRCTL